MTVGVLILLAYLLGSISFGVIASRIFRLPDPRTYGSGNPGATNVLRSGKKKAAAFTLLGDAGKGWLSVAGAQYLAAVSHLGNEAVALAALAVFLGHLCPVFLGFKGGKGVATAWGVLTGLNPWMGLLAALIWLAVAAVSRFSSLAALVAAAFAPIHTAFFLGYDVRTFAVVVMSLMLVWRHKSNIHGLIAGTEPRIGKRGTT